MVELLSSLEGVDAAAMKSYQLRLKKGGQSAAVPNVDVRPVDAQASAPEQGQGSVALPPGAQEPVSKPQSDPV